MWVGVVLWQEIPHAVGEHWVLPWGYVRAKTKNDLAGISALDIAEISLEASGALEVLSSEVRSEF